MAIAPNKPTARVVPVSPLVDAPKPQEILKKGLIAAVKELPTMRKNIVVNAVVNHYYVIVGSYANRAKAAQAVEELKEKGIVKAQIVATNSQFRIAANAYKTKAEANQAIGLIKSKTQGDAWVLEL